MLGFDQVLAGSLVIPSMSVPLCSMPQQIFEFKKSSLLKRIGVTPIKPSLFLFIIGLYYFVAILVSIFWCIIFALLVFGIQYWDSGKLVFDIQGDIKIYSASFKTMLENVNWLDFLYGQILCIVVAICIGLFLAAVAKSTIMIQTIGVSILIISMFLAGTVMPLGLIRNQETFWHLGYVISPFKAPVNIILNGWFGNFSQVGDVLQQKTLIFEQGSIFDINNSFDFFNYKNPMEKVTILNTNEKIISIALPFVWIGSFIGLTIWKFRWNIR